MANKRIQLDKVPATRALCADAWRYSAGSLGLLNLATIKIILSREEENCIKLEQVVSRDPEVVSGALVFAGTRVPVEILIDYLKAGDSLDRFLEGFPTVTRTQAEAFLEMAFEAMKTEMNETHPA